jgi:UDP-N-acetylmuramoyl-tripeptide--D-alanyl-D-alanine ligase
VKPIALSAGDIAAATAGRILSGSIGQVFDGVSIDSRTIAPGDLFVAIRGERFDGHEFVGAALATGAAGALVSEAPAGFGAGRDRPAHSLIEVADTTRALQDIAREVRRRSGARVVAITGSAGKTTTKELTAALLAAKYSVFRNKGNLNNHIGLPLSLIELRQRPDVAVVELGMNHAGEIRTLVGIAEPEVRVWTNVGDAHLGFFGSADAIADAKAEILEGARPSDLLVANADDRRVMERAGRFAGRCVSFGIAERADVRARDVEHRGLEGMSATLVTARGHVRLSTPLLGSGNLSNLLAAAAVASEFDVPLEAIAERAAECRPASRRGELLRLPGGISLIDESYNASPAAVKRSLEILKAATGSARKVAVLGEMLELGDQATRLHGEIGSAAAATGLNLLIAVGGEPARHLAEAARAGGMPISTVAYAPTSKEAADLALTWVRPGDLVLVKGSRGIRTDQIVDRLKVEFA